MLALRSNMINYKHQGPINPNHKRYISNDKSITDVLCLMLRSRSINIHAAELYKRAKISSPTFYLHYRNTDDAREQYEARLSTELAHRIPKNASPQVFFTILINFILHNQQYFTAVSESCDHYWLTEILTHYRKRLVSQDVNDRNFMIYIGILQVTIDCWLKFDLPKEASIDSCVKDLTRVKVPRGR